MFVTQHFPDNRELIQITFPSKKLLWAAHNGKGQEICLTEDKIMWTFSDLPTLKSLNKMSLNTPPHTHTHNLLEKKKDCTTQEDPNTNLVWNAQR